MAGHRVVAPSSPMVVFPFATGFSHVPLPSLTLYPPHWDIYSSLPPFEQLLVAERPGAVGIVVSPLSLSSSCPVLAVLVVLALVLASLSSSPPLPSLQLLARCCCGDGDRPVSTRSTLQARAHSGGRQVLGCGLILVVSAHLAF
jgi:hypothetical protein